MVHPNFQTDDTKPIKAIASILKKDKLKSFYKGILLTAGSCLLLFLVFMGLTNWEIIPVSSKVLDVSNIARLSHGEIIYHLNIKDNKDINCVEYKLDEDGSYHIIPKRSIIEGKRKTEEGLYNDYFLVDVEE